MHPRLAEIAAFLDEKRAALLAAAAAVPADRRDVRPAPDTWSVAEVLDHLLLVESGSTRLLAKRLARAREAGLAAESQTSSMLGALDHSFVMNGAPRQAPELILPRAEVRSDEVVAALVVSRAELLALLAAADGLDLTQVKASHAALGELNMYEWLVFLGHHEARHTRQIARQAVVTAD